MECKNWKNRVSYNDILEILERASDQFSPISITICDKLSKPKEKTFHLFSDYCRGNRINAYIFKKDTDLDHKFSVVPMTELYITSDPKLIAFVIQLCDIN